MGYEADWVKIKKEFEAVTGKKKPSAKFLGVFSRSGLESACKKLDEALAGTDFAAADKAVKSFETTRTSYAATLNKAAQDGDSDYTKEVKKMIDGLTKLSKQAGQRLNAIEEQVERVKITQTAWKTIITDLVATPLKSNKEVVAFCTKPEYAVNQATGKPDGKLAKYQATAKTQLATYLQTLALLSKFDTKQADQAKAKKAFIKLYWQAGDCLSVTEGFMGTLGDWRLYQNTVIAKDDVAKTKYAASPMRVLVDRVNEVMSAENERMGKLERQFETQVDRR